MSVESNKALATRIVVEMWNTKNLNVVDEVYGPNLGLEGTKAFVSSFLEAIPDLHITVADQIGEGDMVATRYMMIGTHQGELFGIPPTGKQFSIPGIEIHRFKNGKLVELWNQIDRLAMMQQLGVLPPM
jgi:steroid delta-isomerase-like uncharacterized protein